MKRNHSKAPFNYQPDGDANFYGLFDDTAKREWLARVQFNGELYPQEQEANMKLFVNAPSLLDVVEAYLDSMVGTPSEGSLAWLTAIAAFEAAAGTKYENSIVAPDEAKKAHQKLPNGFYSWSDTHFNITANIMEADRLNDTAKKYPDGDDGFCEVVHEAREAEGFKGLWQLAEDWTDEFETLHKGTDWDERDFYDTVDGFCKIKLYPEIYETR